jgi:RnfABCDGE-type electron transport complex B subunit
MVNSDPNIITLYIGSKDCIGCSKCKILCPVGAIIGSPQKKHHILDDKCIKCRLCVNSCPKNCIKIKKNTSKNFPQIINFISEITNDATIINAKKQYIDKLIQELEKNNDL